MKIEQCALALDGQHARLLSAGQGPPLILLHGAGESASDWRWVMPMLGRRHRVLAPDLLGHGSLTRAQGATPEHYADSVLRLMDQQGIDRAAVVGNSLGGMVAIDVALSAPDRVSALGLIDSAGLGRAINPMISAIAMPSFGEFAISWAQTSVGAMQRAAMRAQLMFSLPQRVPAEWVAEQCRLALQPCFLQVTLACLRNQINLQGQRVLMLDRLPAIRTRTLIAWGDADRVMPPEQGAQAAQRLLHGRFELIEGAGHLPHVEQPKQFAALLDDFLSEQDGKRSKPRRRTH